MPSNLNTPSEDQLIDWRREFHQYPEPGWCEYWTTVRIVETLEQMDIDEIHVGPDALDPEQRLGVPAEPVLSEWFEKAKSQTDRTDILEQIERGNTGAVAVVENGDGPTVGLRVDIDALPVTESTSENHNPTAEGFTSLNEGYMHACGHDSHITFGLGTLQTIIESDVSGTFKVFFQPSEELLGGGKAMAAGPHITGVDYLMGVHVGLDYPCGTVVAGLDEPLALSRMEIKFQGEPAHAGVAPNEGRNAVQALVSATNNIYGTPRHEAGDTRVNVGDLESDNAANIIANHASASVEVRGETTELMEYMRDSVSRCVNSAAEMYECDAEISLTGEAIREDSDEELAAVVADAAHKIDHVSSIIDRDRLRASEDATYLMRSVKNNGGAATYIGIGGSNPTGHHTSTFDIDEKCLSIGVSTLSQSALELLS